MTNSAQYISRYRAIYHLFKNELDKHLKGNKFVSYSLFYLLKGMKIYFMCIEINVSNPGLILSTILLLFVIVFQKIEFSSSNIKCINI